MKVQTDERTKCLNAMDFVKDWKDWRSTLKDAIKRGRSMGLSDAVIQRLSVKVGDFLAEKVCPATKEEELIKEMWDIASPDERKTLAALIFKMADQ
jgi:sulfur relay (sulfurtransferase) DsrC/TusE family protein